MLSRLRRLIGAYSAALILSYPLLCQTFAPTTHYGPFTYISSQLKAADFNRDGAADLVGVEYFNNGTQTQVVVYMNNGSGGFSAPTVIAGTVGAFSVAIGDFNQDGNLDVAFLTSQVGIAYGNGNGTFRAPVFHTVDGAPNSIALGDYNHDGKPDIATLSNDTKKVTVLLNNGAGYFYYTYSFAVPLYYSTTNSGHSPDNVSNLVSGDFNGNHQTDLAYISQCNASSCGPGLERIYALMNANSTWTPNLVPDQIGGQGELSAADVDLDGKVDLLVSSSGSGGGAGNFGQVFVEYSNGNGSFTRVILDDSTVQAALRIEIWVDGHKAFQDYGDYLNTKVWMPTGTHQVAVVGVDTTGQYMTRKFTYTVSKK